MSADGQHVADVCLDGLSARGIIQYAEAQAGAPGLAQAG
jgi:hypothetical protein